MRFPWWRRALAPLSFGSIVIIVGITLAGFAVVVFMLMLFVLEQAVG